MPTLVLGVPGTWSSCDELISGCARRGYLWAGKRSAVIDLETQEPLPFTVEVYEPDPRLRSAFESASGNQIPKATLAKIARHTMMIYVVTEQPPSAELCLQVMRFANVLLKLGGLAVKVETAGVAHSRQKWRELLALEFPELVAYLALTLRVAEPQERVMYSCGMQHLGLPDAEVPRVKPGQARLLDRVATYLLLEKPTLAEGHTFSLRRGATRFRLRHGPCERFPPGNLFHNPFGVWHLEPMAKRKASPRSR